MASASFLLYPQSNNLLRIEAAQRGKVFAFCAMRK